MAFWKYTREREQDEFSTPGTINVETGTPDRYDEVSQETSDDIAENFTSLPTDKDA